MEETQYNYHGWQGRNELRSAYRGMMRSLGQCLAKNKKEFVVLLNESGIPSKQDESYGSLIDKYVDNICHNQKLMLGTSILLDMYCKKSSADGLDDSNIKNGYFVMRDYLSADGDEEFSYLDPVTIGAISQGVGELSKLGTKALEGRQKKKYGALDLAQKRTETQQALVQAVLQQKQAEIEAQKQEQLQAERTKRTIIIVSATIFGIGLLAIGTIAYLRRKK